MNSSPNPYEDFDAYAAHIERNRYNFRRILGRDHDEISRVGYPFKGPFIFDCRLPWKGRRMGIGDLIVQMNVIQAVRRAKPGQPPPIVLFDPETLPYAETIWRASGLFTWSLRSERPISDVYTNKPPVRGESLMQAIVRGVIKQSQTIPQNYHFLESIVPNECEHGREKGYPGYQMLWNLGWDTEEIEILPLDISLNFNLPKSPKVDVITCNMVELTRGNRLVTPKLWREVIMKTVSVEKTNCKRIVFGCTQAEYPKQTAMVRELCLPQYLLNRVDIVCQSLPQWYDLIERGHLHITGNTSGMWLAFASKSDVVIITESGTEHGQMWEPKAHWFDDEYKKHVSIVNVSPQRLLNIELNTLA